MREICLATGLSSTSTVHSHLKSLEELGYITRTTGLNRSIRIVGEEKASQVPVIGKVTAGVPILAVENIEETYPIPRDLIGCDDDVFMLSVCGDSMINAGILDHDYIIARKQNFANNGDIVVALIDGEETTVKRYFRELRSVRLQPENDKYEPIVGSDNIKVLGKVISVFRML